MQTFGKVNYISVFDFWEVYQVLEIPHIGISLFCGCDFYKARKSGSFLQVAPTKQGDPRYINASM